MPRFRLHDFLNLFIRVINRRNKQRFIEEEPVINRKTQPFQKSRVRIPITFEEQINRFLTMTMKKTFVATLDLDLSVESDLRHGIYVVVFFVLILLSKIHFVVF